MARPGRPRRVLAPPYPIGIKLSFETASSRSATGVVGLHMSSQAARRGAQTIGIKLTALRRAGVAGERRTGYPGRAR